MGGYSFMSENTVSSGLLTSMTDHRMLVWCYEMGGSLNSYTPWSSPHARHCAIVCKIEGCWALKRARMVITLLCLYIHKHINRYRIYITCVWCINIFWNTKRKCKKKKKLTVVVSHGMQWACQDKFSTYISVPSGKPQMSVFEVFGVTVFLISKYITMQRGNLSY